MIKTSTQVSCIILAGGEGKRAGGADKGLVSYENKPLIQHVIDRVRPQTDEIIISANRNIDLYNQYTDKVFSDSSDQSSGQHRGPLAGIAACLNHCKYEWALVVACDMPSLPDNLVERLSDNIQNNSVCIATVNNYHQLALLLRNNLSDSIMSRINKNQLKLIQWVESIPHGTVNFDDNPDAFLNLNTLSETHKS